MSDSRRCCTSPTPGSRWCPPTRTTRSSSSTEPSYLVDLDDRSSLDPQSVGSKAARLAVARHHALPVLPGFVVTAPASREHMRLGAEALVSRGSGGARLVVSGTSFEPTGPLVDAGRRLAPRLVARSSTLLEGSGEWAGAFNSYGDVAPGQLPKAVVGCWASAFSVDALERQVAAGISPGTVAMAVLVQPALHPQWGGVAELGADGSTVVHGVAGSPAPLLQGWVPGHGATRSGEGEWVGELVDTIGTRLLDEICRHLRDARLILGTNRCEWAVAEGRAWLLQLDIVATTEPLRPPTIGGSGPDWVRLVRNLVAAPGRLGIEQVLPWALTGVPKADPLEEVGPEDVESALQMSRRLTAEVWGLPEAEALEAAAACLDTLLGPEPQQALETIRQLRKPDEHLSLELMALLHGLRQAVADRGLVSSPEAAWHLSTSQIAATLQDEGRVANRVGAVRWEPLIAAVVLTHGSRHRGRAASPGLGSGRLESVPIRGPEHAPHPRSVVYSDRALPVLSQLLWDAAGLVTHGGSAAAHLFESARSLGVPAVTGVDLSGDVDLIVAVDGFEGIVATLETEG